MTEEQLESMCPSAASIAAIVKPGMKFFDVGRPSLVTIVMFQTNAEHLPTLYILTLQFEYFPKYTVNQTLQPQKKIYKTY